MILALGLPLVLLFAPQTASQVAPGPFDVNGRVTDGADALPGVFVALASESAIEEREGWERIPVELGTFTDGEGRFRFEALPFAFGERYYVFTGALDRFDQIWSAGEGGLGGLPTLPTRGDLELLGANPLVNDRDHGGVGFALSVSNRMAGVQVPVGEQGVTLLTDVYGATDGSRPTEGSSGNPVVLVRTPYATSGSDPSDPNGAGLLATYASWTTLGYTVVLQNTRGRNGSTGTTDVFRTDAWGGAEMQDGADTIDWIAAQPWCDGNVGMVGPSALAITGYLAAGASPQALKAAYVWAGTPDVYTLYFDGGVYREEALEPWLAGQLGGAAARDAYLQAPGKIVANPERSGFWDTVDVGTRLGEVRIPMLHVVGWFDLFRHDGIQAFRELDLLSSTAGPGHAGGFGTQRLLIGPYAHTDWWNRSQGDLVLPETAGPLPGEGPHPAFSETLAFKSELRFFDHWLRLEPRGIDGGYASEPRVRYFTLGNADDPDAPGNEWRTAETWPPASTATESRRLYFTGQGPGLLEDPPANTGVPRRAVRRTKKTYVHDPLDPVPTVGGPILVASPSMPAGPRDQQALEARDDVLTFSTPVLTEPLEVTGEVTAHLAFSSEGLDTDFVVRLCDVYPDGRSILLVEGVRQARYRNGFASRNDLLSGDSRRVEAIDVPLGHVSAVFDAGHRLRIDVASSSFPRLKPNPGTGASFFTEDLDATNSVAVRNTIWCDPGTSKRASWVTLPVVGGP
jgi:putative CocE/NonD family hydrolase